MQVHDLVQGSPEWHAHRRNFFNASDAPAMMGCSPYKSRDQLIRELATGVGEEITPEKAAIFAEGHRCEALARLLAEEIIGEDLYPVVGTEGKLSASFDGLTMDESTGFEHKMLNDDLRAAFDDIVTIAPEHHEKAVWRYLPSVYQIQLEQQCMVAGLKRILFMASNWQGDELVEERHCWYTPNPGLAEEIRLGWEQLEKDVCAYVPEVKPAKPVADTIKQLPALVVSVEGRVVETNLKAYQIAAVEYFNSISTDLTTDADFVNADASAKFCKEVEERLDLVKKQALSQTASIDELFRTIDAISDTARQKRLNLEKLIDKRKQEIKTEICNDHQAQLNDHIAELNKRLGHAWIPATRGAFAEAIKGKKTVDTLRSAASEELARTKVALTALANRLEANRKALLRDDQDYIFLFADFATVGSKEAEDFAAIADKRIRDHLEAEAARKEEIERKAAEQPVAQAPAPTVSTPAAAPSPEPAHPLPSPGTIASPMINLGTINERLGFNVTADFLAQLGFPCVTVKNAKQYRASQFPLIVQALIDHLQSKIEQRVAA